MRRATLAVTTPAVAAPAGPSAPPLHPAASFEEDPAVVAAILAGREPGFVYARNGNPTARAAEEHVAQLEGGETAVWCASGMAAILAAIAARCVAGDEVLCASEIYGGTSGLLTGIVSRWGIAVRYAPAEALEVGPRTRAVIVETIANPALTMPDLPALARRKGDAWLVVDNTFATPMLCRPLEHGADVVVHSVSKYLGGHGDLIAGIGVGSAAVIEPMRGIAAAMGLTGDPWTAWLAMRGMRTLAVRMERHCENARLLALHLRDRGFTVRTPEPTAWLADRGGMLTVDLGSRDAAFAAMRAFRVFRCAPSMGDCQSLVLHPASTSHRNLDDAGLRAAGIAPGTLRVSVGIEDVRDLIEDFERGLAATTPSAPSGHVPR
jgi:methionine-gamma-lyase